MLFRTFPQRPHSPLREHRTIAYDQNVETSGTDETSGPLEDLKKMEGVGDAHMHFAVFDISDINQKALQDYIAITPATPEGPSHIRSALRRLFEDASLDPTKLPATDPNDPRSLQERQLDVTRKRLHAVRVIDRFVRYLQERRSVSDVTMKKLTRVEKNSELPWPPSMGLRFAKGSWKRAASVWSTASGEAKITIAAGIVSSYLLWNKIASWKDNEKPGVQRLMGKSLDGIKNIAGIGIGIGLLVAMLDSINTTVEKMSGKPIVNPTLKGGRWFPHLGSKQEWDAAKYQHQIKDEWSRLKGMNVPVQSMAGSSPEEAHQQRYAFGITNLCGLSVLELRELYENHRTSRTIPDGEQPTRPFAKDGLTPDERFTLVEDTANMLTFIDKSSGNFAWKVSAQDPNEKLSVLYLVLDYNHRQ